MYYNKFPKLVRMHVRINIAYFVNIQSLQHTAIHVGTTYHSS